MNTIANTITCSDCGTEVALNDSRFGQYCEDCGDNYFSCSNCEELVHSDDVQTHNDTIYCQGCFDEMFVCCSDCSEYYHQDEVYDGICRHCEEENYCTCNSCENRIHRDDALYDEDDEPYCENCYRESDDDIPKNPEIGNDELIATSLLCKAPIANCPTAIRCWGNFKDVLIPNLIFKLGPVKHPVYLYGLKDREEYQLKLSVNVAGQIKKALAAHGLTPEILITGHASRIGIARQLRQEHFSTILKVLKSALNETEDKPCAE